VSFPREAYRKENYYILLVDFSLANPYDLSVVGDYIDLYETDQDPTKILIKLNHGEALRLSDAIPIISPFSHISIYNQAGNTGYLKLLIGHELFRSQRQNVSIVSDKVGLAKDSSISGTKVLKFANVSVGTTATQITTTSTLANVLIIQNNSSVDVFLGDSTLQNIKIPANGGTISVVMPMNFKVDLSTLYLVSSTTVTVAVMYA